MLEDELPNCHNQERVDDFAVSLGGGVTCRCRQRCGFAGEGIFCPSFYALAWVPFQFPRLVHAYEVIPCLQ